MKFIHLVDREESVITVLIALCAHVLTDGWEISVKQVSL